MFVIVYAVVCPIYQHSDNHYLSFFPTALFVLIYAVVCAIGMVRAARLLHDGMFLNVLRSPMAFFDTTPTGRVLNRFSRDVDTVDTTIPQLIRTWMTSFFTVCSCIFVIAYSTPIFLCVVPPLGIIYYAIQVGILVFLSSFNSLNHNSLQYYNITW